jgi:hypothetical protein
MVSSLGGSMKTLVFAFDVSKLNDAEFNKFMEALFRAQDGVHLGLCKYNTFDLHGVMKIHDKLDELRGPGGEEIEGKS